MATRKDKISGINNKLSECKECERIDKPRPFYFSNYNLDCKVILITWKPSIQAIYRPLFSTRFFRVLSLALFGAYPKRRDFIELFNSGEIFWTHLQKCYTEKIDIIAQELCAKFYIKREIEVIKPTVVVVLGDIAKKFIENHHYYKDNKSEIKWCFAQIPKTGKEEDFVIIREALSHYIPGIDIEPVTNDIDLSISWDIEEKVSKHAAFELEGIKRWVSKVFSEGILEEIDYDAKWFNTYVIPYFTSQVLVSLACSYFEEHIKMLLYYHGFTKDQFVYKRKDNKGKEIDVYLCMEKLLSELTKKTYKGHVKDKYRDILVNVENFKKLRNAFVHDGGFLDVPYKDISNIKYFPDVKSGYNHIEITYENIKEIIALMEQFVRMLDEIEKAGLN